MWLRQLLDWQASIPELVGVAVGSVSPADHPLAAGGHRPLTRDRPFFVEPGIRTGNAVCGSTLRTELGADRPVRRVAAARVLRRAVLVVASGPRSTWEVVSAAASTSAAPSRRGPG